MFTNDPYGKRVIIFPGNLSWQRPALIISKDVTSKNYYWVASVDKDSGAVIKASLPSHQIKYGW